MLRDPFTVDDEAILYVPRAASERVLGELEQALRRGTHPVALIGAVGIGKSLLFKVVAQRLAGQACCVPVSYEGWSVAELCQWVIRELDARETLEGERALAHRPTLVKFREWMQRERSYLQKGDPETALLELAGDLQGRGFPITLLVDDADSMKPDTAARLVELTAQANGGLVLGLALTEGAPGAGALRGALAPGLKEIRFFEPMTLEETMLYVKERLVKIGASRELRACLDEGRIRRIYRYTEGNPRRVHGEVGLLHLELSRVRAGIAVREGEPSFAPIDAPVSPFSRSFEPRAVEALEASTPEPSPRFEPEPPPWRLREEEQRQSRFEPQTQPQPEVEVDETEVALAALTPQPLPEPAPIPEPIAFAEPAPEPQPAEPEPVALILPTEPEAEPELWLEAEVDTEPVLEGLELSDEGEELELQVLGIEELVQPAPTEPPAAIPPTPFALAPEPAPAVEQPRVIEEPHLIAPETLAALRASAAEVEDAERRQEPPVEPLGLRVVSVDEQTPNAELYAEVRRDWEDLSQRSAPLASVALPPASSPAAPARPELKRRTAPEPPKAGMMSKAVAALAAVAAVLFLGIYFGSRSSEPDTELPGVAAPAPEPSEGPADPAPEAPKSTTAAPAPTPAPALPAPDGGEPSMIATNIQAKPWARIEIDGVDSGETPLGDVILREGPHTFRAFLPDGRVIERTEKISRANSRILFE